MPPPAPASAVPSIAGLFVALIEDEADVRESTVRLLVHNNCKVLAVADADQLLVAMASLARTPDILLSDYRLADGDGVEAVQRVRQVVGHTLPALLLTGSTAPADVLRYQAAGIEVLLKPFGIAELRQAMVAEIKALNDSLGLEH